MPHKYTLYSFPVVLKHVKHRVTIPCKWSFDFTWNPADFMWNPPKTLWKQIFQPKLFSLMNAGEGLWHSLLPAPPQLKSFCFFIFVLFLDFKIWAFGWWPSIGLSFERPNNPLYSVVDPRGRPAYPQGPDSFVFYIQTLRNVATSGVSVPHGKSWIRHWHLTHLFHLFMQTTSRAMMTIIISRPTIAVTK